MTFDLPNGYSRQGVCIIFLTENLHGASCMEIVATICDEELFAHYLAGHVNIVKSPDAALGETLVNILSRMKPYSIDSSDDQLEDAVTALNSLMRMVHRTAAFSQP